MSSRKRKNFPPNKQVRKFSPRRKFVTARWKIKKGWGEKRETLLIFTRCSKSDDEARDYYTSAGVDADVAYSRRCNTTAYENFNETFTNH